MNRISPSSGRVCLGRRASALRTIKLSDYVVDFLSRLGIRHVFAISGGASVHLIDSIARHPRIDYVCTHHEQAASMAADAYSRVTGRWGAAISTSGPGATNMLTGACCAYYDSIPVLYITGQVARFRNRGDTGVRQMGFQETDSVEIFRPVTKYAVRVDDPRKIRYELEKACFIARSGRPGPVLLDLPDDLQRESICPESLERFTPPEEMSDGRRLEEQAGSCLALLAKAERPVLILGGGVRLAGAGKQARLLAERLGVPVLPTWAVRDLFPADHPLLVGPFGTHGTRYGNFAVQNADLVVAIGARLDTREAGSPATSFARGARKVVVDIDPSELGKFGRLGVTIDLPIEADAGTFIRGLLRRLGRVRRARRLDWLKRIGEWKRLYPICLPDYERERNVNPYVFFRSLSRASSPGDIVFSDTGCALAWTMQAFDFKEGQRFFHAFNCTPMGYGLPGAIGASLALGRRPVTLISGDGSFMMNIQELQTVVYQRLPIRMFLINNRGYSMIRQTQDQWLGSRYEASSAEGGVTFPDFAKVARAHGIKVVSVRRNGEIDRKIRQVFGMDGPVLCDVEIDPAHRVVPQVVYGRPIEDAGPLLERKEFLSNMIVPPEKASLE
ncbi:MAG: thiamine pyrophosphate-binding protein [Planctomycetes bacterium]|nr:thiamine pyrophosphate-binding protein [Planctomycetota bacterium]